MNNCSICSIELKTGFFGNIPRGGIGKLKDDSIICSSCFLKINNINPKVAGNLKNFSLDDIKNYLQNPDKDINTRLEEIKNEIKNLNLKIDTPHKDVLKQKEIDELPNILNENEKIDNAIVGIATNKGLGILVSTNRRLIFISKDNIFKTLKVEDYSFDKISSIEYSIGWIDGKIKIHTIGNYIEVIDNVDKLATREFSEFIRNKLSQKNDNSELNILEQLEKLGKLRDNGILTEEEFIEQKKKLL